jgi:hypothetical protein
VRILFDQGTPVPLRRHLTPHKVETAYERGWSTLRNGDLLNRAESERFDVLVTTDANIRYQQNLTDRRISIVVLSTTSWPRIQRALDEVVQAIDSAPVSGYTVIPIP